MNRDDLRQILRALITFDRTDAVVIGVVAVVTLIILVGQDLMYR